MEDQAKDPKNSVVSIGSKNNSANLIYHDYSGLAGEIGVELDESQPESGKSELEIEKRRIIAENLEEKALQREKEKTEAFFERFKNFLPIKQDEITNNQKEAEEIIGHYIKDEKDIEGLSEEERFVLNKIRNEYREFKKNNQSGSFNFDLANEVDKMIYTNLIYDISFRIVGAESPIKRIKPSSSVTEASSKIQTDLSEKPEEPFVPKIEPEIIKIKPIIKVGGLEVDPNARFLTIKYLKQKQNIVDEEKAEEVMAIIRDWVYYGGDFYKYWTGRALKLKKGVDYRINADGTIDEQSFFAARNKQVEDWLKQPVNRTWIATANEFKKNNIDKISERKQKVEIKDAKGKIHEEEKYTTPYFLENGWLFYESNYYDLSIGAMTQREREPSKYRIYFNLENQDVIKVYSEIIGKLSMDEDISRFGFGANTIAMFDPTAEVIAETISQRDKIIIFIGENGINRALPILQDYIKKNRAKFEKRGVLLAQKFFDQDGKEVPGVDISSDVRGVSPDSSRGFKKYKSFNSMQSEIIQSTLYSVFKEIYNFDNLDKIGFTNPQLKDKLLEIGHDGKLEDYLPLFLTQQSGAKFLIKNLAKFYPKWSRAFGMSEINIAFKEEEK